jgi:hypothetical protein
MTKNSSKAAIDLPRTLPHFSGEYMPREGLSVSFVSLDQPWWIGQLYQLPSGCRILKLDDSGCWRFLKHVNATDGDGPIPLSPQTVSSSVPSPHPPASFLLPPSAPTCAAQIQNTRRNFPRACQTQAPPAGPGTDAPPARRN